MNSAYNQLSDYEKGKKKHLKIRCERKGVLRKIDETKWVMQLVFDLLFECCQIEQDSGVYNQAKLCGKAYEMTDVT